MSFGQSPERIEREIEQLELELEEIEATAAEAGTSAAPRATSPEPDPASYGAHEKKLRRKLPAHRASATSRGKA